MDRDSVEYQRAVEGMARANVVCRVSQLAQELLGEAPESETVLDLWRRDPSLDELREWAEDSGLDVEKDAELGWFASRPYSVAGQTYPSLYGPYGTELGALRAAVEGEDEDGALIEGYVGAPLEQWAVSDWLARELAERGETVRELGELHVWLRRCSGQAIYCDRVICDVYDGMWGRGGE